MKSSTIIWLVVGVLVTIGAAGLVVTLLLRQPAPADPSPSVSTPGSASPSATASGDLEPLPLSSYPAESGGLTLGDAMGLPTYDQWTDGPTLAVSLMPGDLMGPWRAQLDVLLPDEGITAQEVLPGVWCYDSTATADAKCDTIAASGRRWDVQQTEGQWTHEQLAQWLQDFVAAVPE